MHGRAAHPAVPIDRDPGVPVVLCEGQDGGFWWVGGPSGQVLFIDARNLGYMVDRAERALSDDDIAQIANTYHAWRGAASARQAGLEVLGCRWVLLLGVVGGDQGGGLRADAGTVCRSCGCRG